MQGIKIVTGPVKKPEYHLPKNWEGLKVCIVSDLGIGDALIIAGVAGKELKRKAACHLTMAVKPHQMELIKEVDGVDDVISVSQLCGATTFSSFDVKINTTGTLATAFHIKKGSYYKNVGEFLGVPGSRGSFKNIESLTKNKRVSSVFIHPGASNPNRRWDDEKWRELAYELRDRGLRVVWLGTCDEFGFNDSGIVKISDENENLVWQVKQLAKKATYFIGNDSGFAHIAGMLNIPGVVLFFSTSSKDVIGEYPELSGLDVFDRSGLKPSRSLNPQDNVHQHTSAILSVNDVLKHSGLDIIEKDAMTREERPAKKLNIGIYGTLPQTDELASFLAQFYDVEILEEFTTNGTPFDVLIAVEDFIFRKDLSPGSQELAACAVTGSVTDWKDNGVIIATFSTAMSARVRVHISHPENARRAIREILGKD